MLSKKKVSFFILTFGVLGSFFYWQLSQEPSPQAHSQNTKPPLSKAIGPRLSKNQIQKLSPLLMPTVKDPDLEWNNWLHKQSEQIGYLTENPQEAQANLQKSADSIPAEKLDWLKNRAKNVNINTDERLLAIEYLSLNSSSVTLDQLEDIALSPLDPQMSPTLKNESLMLKAAAIEGFNKKENLKSKAIAKLNYISQNTDEQFLIDRAQRSLWHLKGKAKTPEEQDTEALKSLFSTE